MSTKWSTQVLGSNSTPNFGELLKDEYAVILLRGKNTFNDLIYCYLKVMLPDIDKLHDALKGTSNFNASDFGTVLAAGKGEPPEEVRAEIALSHPMLEQPKPFRASATPPVAPEEKKNWDEY